jgi:hypothetical protein
VLALPFRHADVSVKLPPSLQLAATASGHMDCRMQLLGLQLDWPATAAAEDSTGTWGWPQQCTLSPILLCTTLSTTLNVW